MSKDATLGQLLRLCKKFGKDRVIGELEKQHKLTMALLDTANEEVSLKTRNDLLQRWEKQERTLNYLRSEAL